MFGFALNWERGARGICSVGACLCLISSCSLRDTDKLESGPAASGQGSSGEGSSGSAGESAGGGSSAGNNQGGEASGGEPSGEAGEGGAAGQSGGETGGTGGTIDPGPTGSFEYCPGRFAWKLESFPDEATVSNKASQLGIAFDQMLPKYSIDDMDKSGEATRFSAGQPMTGNEFLSVDMGVEKWVSGVYLNEPATDKNSGKPNNDYARQIQISVSKDGLSFAEVAMQEGTPGVLKIAFTPVVARYVRVSQMGTAEYWWSLHDYKIYCTNDIVPGGGGGASGNPGLVGGGGKGGAGGTGGN